MTTEPAIAVEQLSKRFGAFIECAYFNLQFSAERAVTECSVSSVYGSCHTPPRE